MHHLISGFCTRDDDVAVGEAQDGDINAWPSELVLCLYADVISQTGKEVGIVLRVVGEVIGHHGEVDRVAERRARIDELNFEIRQTDGRVELLHQDVKLGKGEHGATLAFGSRADDLACAEE